MPRPRAKVRARVARAKVRGRVRGIKAKKLRALGDLIADVAQIERIAHALRMELEEVKNSIQIEVGSRVFVRPVVDGSCPPPK